VRQRSLQADQEGQLLEAAFMAGLAIVDRV
jgi:hypothetical protein